MRFDCEMGPPHIQASRTTPSRAKKLPEKGIETSPGSIRLDQETRYLKDEWIYAEALLAMPNSRQKSRGDGSQEK